MQKKTNKASGYVNFPLESTQYKNTNEGGMVVKLVVMPLPTVRKSKKKQKHEVFGSSVLDIRSIELVGDDKIVPPSLANYGPDSLSIDEYFTLLNKINTYLDEVHYPFSIEKAPPSRPIKSFNIQKFISIPYKAVIILGETGWSGLDEKSEQYWRCTYSDLTEEGKTLYNAVKVLYKEHEIRLLTFLDT